MFVRLKDFQCRSLGNFLNKKVENHIEKVNNIRAVFEFLNVCINFLFVFILKILEPVASVGPKVEIKDKAGIFLGRSEHSLALLCPAQSYPVPVYR